MSLLILPEDLLLEIIIYLEVDDLLAFKQTCRAIHASASSDYVSHRLAAHFQLPLDICPWETISGLSGSEIQRRMVRALKLDRNWRQRAPQVKGLIHVRGHTVHDDELSISEMELLPGAQWLLTAQSNRRRGRSSVTFSFWSLHSDEPYKAASLEIQGKYMYFAAQTVNGASPATLAVTFIDEHKADWLDVYNVPLEERWTRSQIPTVKETRVTHVRKPDGCSGTLHKVRICGRYVAVTIVDPSQHHFVLVVDTVSHHELVLTMPQSYVHGIHIDFIEEELIVIGIAGITIRRLKVGPLGSLFGTMEGDTDTIRLAEAEVLPTEPITTDPLISLASTLQPGRKRALRAINLVAFAPGRLQLGRIPCNSGAADSMWSRFPIPNTASQDYARIGPQGARGVWLERDYESEQIRVVKLAASASDSAADISTGLLIPPYPNLPFRPQECRSLAFDEAKGRLCVGLYSGDVCVLDFV